MLLARAESIFPEGFGGPRAEPKDGTAAAVTNELLVNVKEAVDELWKLRGYMALKADAIKDRLGYPLDREEAVGYVVTSSLNLPLLSPDEARTIGKRVGSIVGQVSAKLKLLRKRGKSTAPQIAALLCAPAVLNLTPAPRKSAAPPLRPPPQPPPPPTLLPPPLPPPSVPLPAAEPRVDYADAGDQSYPFWATERHPEIPGYRGRPGGSDDERYWNPAKPPCVPSDHRPGHLFNSRQAAEAAGLAARVERFAPRPDEDGEDEYHEEELYELACVKHKHAMRRLHAAFPELAAGTSSEHHTRPCPCGRRPLAVWPWVVQTAQLGFCECHMAGWEQTCWRSEWIAAGYPNLAW